METFAKVFFIGIFMYMCVLGIGFLLKKDKTSEELKQEANTQKIAQENKAKADKQAAIKFNRIKSATIAAQNIQQSARNPESVSWSGVLSNDDASVICFELRAQNGFGGMSLEQIAVIKGAIKTSDSAWNKNCANKTMHDITTDVIKLLKIYR
ncbi:MAG: hypothetical protein H7Z70_08080 [Bacteroidia bacterium]|nr:hypothetical protein [Methylotenera sp.]